jgi:hypothetical protein
LIRALRPTVICVAPSGASSSTDARVPVGAPEPNVQPGAEVNPEQPAYTSAPSLPRVKRVIVPEYGPDWPTASPPASKANPVSRACRCWCVSAGVGEQPLVSLPMQSAKVRVPSAPARKCVTAFGPSKAFELPVEPVVYTCRLSALTTIAFAPAVETTPAGSAGQPVP